MNIATVTGNIHRLEVRYSKGGNAWATFGVRVSGMKDDDGNRPSAFLDCKAFGDLAERIEEQLPERSRVVVSGRLTPEEWTDKDGNDRNKLVLVVDEAGAEVRFGGVTVEDDGNGGGGSSRSKGGRGRPAPSEPDDDVPF